MEEKNQNIEEGMSISGIFSILFKRKLLIILCTILCAIITAVIAIFFITPKYSSVGSVVVVIKTDGDDGRIDYSNSQKIIQTIASLMTKDIVIEKVISDIDEEFITKSFVKNSLSVKYSTTNYMIDVVCTCEYKDYCNIIVDSVIENVIMVSNTKEFALLNNTIVQIEKGTAPVYASPNRTAYTVIGFLIGFVLSVCISFVLEFINPRFKNSDEIEKILDTKVIGKMVDCEKKSAHRIKIALDTLEKNENEYIKLCSAIDFSNIDNKLKIIQITSSIAGEGKTTLAVNLAKTIESLNKKVLLIDVDLRKSTVSHYFDVPKTPGFTDYAVGVASLDDITNKISENLYVINGGTHSPNTLVLMNSGKLEELLSSLREKFDFILVDTPPVLVGADSLVTAKYTDGILFVVSQKDSIKKLARDTFKQIESRNFFVIGTVFNKINKKYASKDFYYYNYYSKY